MRRKLISVLIVLAVLAGYFTFEHVSGNLVKIDDVVHIVPEERILMTPDRYEADIKGYLEAVSEGNLGTFSVRSGRRVTDTEIGKMILDMAIRSTKILLPALLLGIGAGVLLGALIYFVPQAVRKVMVAVNQVVFSIPDLLLIVFFQLGAIWIDRLVSGPLIGVVEVDGRPIHLLPITTVAVPIAAYMFGYTVNACREVLQQDFIRTSRAKGLPYWKVFLKHVMRPAADSILAVVPKMAAVSAAGLVIVERLYNIRGVTYFFNGASLGHPSMPKMLATLLVCLAVYSIGVKMITSLLRLWVNPALRNGGGA